MNYPKFKYIENAEDVIQFSDKTKKCDCCGKETNLFTDFIYSQKNVNVICSDCIISGLACEKFEGEFNEVPYINNKSAMEELSKRTPHLSTYQEIEWPVCCNDFCKYLRTCTSKDLKDKQILKDLEETFEDDFFSLEEIKKFNPNFLQLFKCIKCEKYYVKVDLD